MLFAAICTDKPDHLGTRLDNRAAHLAYLEAHPGRVKAAGPFLDAEEKPCGSLLILDFADSAQVRTFLENDPYAKAGLFASTDLRAWRQALGVSL